jgi:hypothetical protein
MTIEHMVFLATGVLVNGLTFALGIAVGVSLKRKDFAHHGYDYEKSRWHRVERRGTEGGIIDREKRGD